MGKEKLSDDKMISLRETNLSNSENVSIGMGQLYLLRGTNMKYIFLPWHDLYLAVFHFQMIASFLRLSQCCFPGLKEGK